MTLGVMEGFIFCLKIIFLKKVSDFDLSRGYLIRMVKIFFEIFLQKSVNFAPLNLRIVRGHFKLCQIS